MTNEHEQPAGWQNSVPTEPAIRPPEEAATAGDCLLPPLTVLGR